MVMPRSLTPLSCAIGSLFSSSHKTGGKCRTLVAWQIVAFDVDNLITWVTGSLLSKVSWSGLWSKSGVKMSNQSWVFSCRNESRVIREKRIINQEDLEARVWKKYFQDGDWDAFPCGWPWSGEEGGKRNGIKREEGRRRGEVRHPGAEKQVELKS